MVEVEPGRLGMLPWKSATAAAGSRFRSTSRRERAYWLALLVALLLGAFLRLNGYLWHQSSFWLDEALWAPRFIDWPLQKLGIRPIGFVWLVRQLVTHFGATEQWFRFIPNLSGLLSLALLPYVASRLVDSRVLRVLLVLVFAVHPGMVDLSKEFKPYTFEVLVHLVTLALYLRYEQTRRARWLYALLAYLPVAFLLAYNLAFALPSLLLVAFWAGFRQRSYRLMGAAVLGGLLCAGVIYEANSLILKSVAREGRTEEYWGKKYDLFYRGEQDGSRLTWTLSKSADMAAVIGLQRELWEEQGRLSSAVAARLGDADRYLWTGLTLLGAVLALYQRRAHALLLLLPFAVIIGVNMLGKWPFGPFRTNLFSCVYLFPLPFLGLDKLGSLLGRRYAHPLVAIAALSVVLGFGLAFDPAGRKRVWCGEGYTRQVLQALYELRHEELRRRPRANRARLVLDLFSHKPLDYYLNVHPQVSREYADFYQQFKVDKVSSSRLSDVTRLRLRGTGPVYAVASKASSVASIAKLAESNARVVRERRIADNVVVVVLDD